MLDSAKLRLQQTDFLAVAPEVAASVAKEAALNEAKLPKLTEQEACGRADAAACAREVDIVLALAGKPIAARRQAV